MRLSAAITEFKEDLGRPNTEKDKQALSVLLRWFEELEALRTDNVAALRNAVIAVQRMLADWEQAEEPSAGDQHYINRLHRLNHNLREIIELEEAADELPGNYEKET